MKITRTRYGDTTEYSSLEQYAEGHLDGDDYGKGAMEAAADTARNNSKAIGRLLDLLSEKHLVTAEEVVATIEGWVNGSAVFGDREETEK